MPQTTPTRALATMLALLLASAAAAQTDAELAQEDRIRELERKVDVLTDELERTQMDIAVPQDPELVSTHGMGPGASKVYNLDRGLSIGGYAEGLATFLVDDKKKSESNTADFLRGVLYVGYKFTDRILFNMEIEIEHASTDKSGSVSLEFAQLDFLMTDWANARAGLLLIPMGFLNEIHEPPFYFGTHRPATESRIIPTTWRENGAGLFGSFFGDLFEYRAYAVNSFDGAGFDASGVRGGRQKGSKALAEDWAFTGRLDFKPIPELLVGGSVFIGNTGQDQVLSTFDNNGNLTAQVGLPSARTTVWDAHAQFQWQGLWLRALVAGVEVSDAALLTSDLQTVGTLPGNQAIAEQMIGTYGEIAYDVWQWIDPTSEVTLEPFYRYEFVDTQQSVPDGFRRDLTKRNYSHTLGVSLKPIPNVVLKADYVNRIAAQGGQSDQVNLGIGVVF